MTQHSGSCHCGNVRYEADLDLSVPVIECNCSYCLRNGFLLSFIPESKFSLLSGKEELTEYRFNKKVISHLFCRTCGVQCFGEGTSADGAKTVAVNVRTLENIDLSTIVRQPYDGKSQ
ncbi:MAG: GFA family protein [Candidatus Gracilibacteria bacterium]|nr:GFA family protein [Candidatus Gracilibacteria bacterium]